MSETYTDLRGRTAPPEGWYGPGHVYLGTLHRGRVCYDTEGRRMKIVRQGAGSTVVRRAGQPKTIKGRTFTPPETLTLAPSTAVRFTREAP
jgi:hypothetical protein